MKISWFAFIIYFVAAHSSLLATDQCTYQEELKFQNQMQQNALNYQRNYAPMTFLPDLCSWQTAAGFGMGTLNVGLGTLAIAPEAVICSHGAASASCTLSGILAGILGGGVFVVSLVGTGYLVTCRYFKVSKYNRENIQHHIELLYLIETAFNYDDNGLIKHTPKDTKTTEETILIEASDNDVIHHMIKKYHMTNPTYQISAPELARRIRRAVFAGYFTPYNFGIENFPEAGKWANIQIDILMTNLMIKLDDLKTYYGTVQENFNILYKHWEEIQRAEKRINSPVFDLSNPE